MSRQQTKHESQGTPCVTVLFNMSRVYTLPCQCGVYTPPLQLTLTIISQRETRSPATTEPMQQARKSTAVHCSPLPWRLRRTPGSFLVQHKHSAVVVGRRYRTCAAGCRQQCQPSQVGFKVWGLAAASQAPSCSLHQVSGCIVHEEGVRMSSYAHVDASRLGLCWHQDATAARQINSAYSACSGKVGS